MVRQEPGSNRIGHTDGSETVSAYIEESVRHIIVICENHFYKVNIMDEKRRPLPAAALESAFNSILLRSKEKKEPSNNQ